jgi:dTDP-D-glucose 4,6-dehydratase
VAETILVTGGCGFIRSCFVLHQKEWEPGAVIPSCLDGQRLSIAVTRGYQGEAS